MKSYCIKIIFVFNAFMIGHMQQATAQSLEDFVVRADSLYQAGNIDQTIEVYEEAIVQYPENPMLYVVLGELKCGMVTRFSTDEKAYQAGIEQLDKALSIDSTFYPALNSKARINLFYQKYDKAIAGFTKALEYVPSKKELVICLSDRGSAKTYSQDFEGAIEDLNKALELKPGDRKLLVNIGTTHLFSKNFLKAEQVFLKLYEIIPEDNTLLNNLGFVYIELEKYKKAREMLSKVIQQAPNEPFAYNNLGYVEIKLGNLEKGMELIDHSLSIYPENSYAYKQRAIGWIALKNMDQACLDLNKASKLGYSVSYGEEVGQLMEEHCK